LKEEQNCLNDQYFLYLSLPFCEIDQQLYTESIKSLAAIFYTLPFDCFLKLNQKCQEAILSSEFLKLKSEAYFLNSIKFFENFRFFQKFIFFPAIHFELLKSFFSVVN
jgi:hypothetical protein